LGGHELRPLEEKKAVSVLEEIAKKQGFRIARFEASENKKAGKQEPRWRTVTMPVSSMEILLKSTAATKHLPRIRNIVSCPVLIQEGSNCKILTQGYHKFNGGTYITSGGKVPEVSFEAAVGALLLIHQDFEFNTLADKARAIAGALSPTLRMGGLIQGDFPLDVAEAAAPQSGKNLLHKCHAAIYNELPTAITPPKGGAGSFDEKLSQEMIKGRPFICLSNIRGPIDSSILEEAIRGAGRVSCRASYSRNITVDTCGFIWQMSTNGAEFTPDLAARAVVTRICKRPSDYIFASFEEGDLCAHIKAHQIFRPELIGRFDEKIVFNPLSPDTQREIGRLVIAEEIERLRGKGYELTVSDPAFEFLVRRGIHKTLGARPMRKTVQKCIGDAIRDAIKTAAIPSGTLVVSPHNDSLSISSNNAQA